MSKICRDGVRIDLLARRATDMVYGKGGAGGRGKEDGVEGRIDFLTSSDHLPPSSCVVRLFYILELKGSQKLDLSVNKVSGSSIPYSSS